MLRRRAPAAARGRANIPSSLGPRCWIDRSIQRRIASLGSFRSIPTMPLIPHIFFLSWSIHSGKERLARAPQLMADAGGVNQEVRLAEPAEQQSGQPENKYERNRHNHCRK